MNSIMMVSSIVIIVVGLVYVWIYMKKGEVPLKLHISFLLLILINIIINVLNLF